MIINRETVRFTERMLLALTLWREARGEGSPGMLAVGCVIRNRRNAWGGSIWQQVTARRQFSAMTILGDPQTIKWPSPIDALWQDAVRLADALLSNGVDDPTQGALYYWNPRVATSEWFKNEVASKMRKTAVIGNHEFFAP